MTIRKVSCWALILMVTAVGLAVADEAAPKPAAFPGAEGFGAVSVGGRGGRVIKVTNLNASGPGSLQAACSAKGPRIVIFEVSGVIPVTGRGKYKALYIADSRITIAGQTAPGAGITITGPLSTKPFYDRRRVDPTAPRISDLTIRFLRFRLTNPAPDAVRLVAAKRFILDHVSGSWALDETMDFSVSQRYTIQWCGIEESAWKPREKYRIGDSQQFKSGGNRPHNYGMIMGYTDKGNVSLHHNLFAHHNRRTPLCGVEILDHRNNVIYNVAQGIMFHSARANRDRPGKPFRANIVANYFKPGPSAVADGKDALPGNKAGGWFRCSMVAEAGADIYAEGNHFASVGKTLDVWKADAKMREIGMGKCIKAEKPWPAPPVTTQKAEDAYKSVLAHVGCLPRDSVSKRMVKDTREGTGEWGRHEPKGGLMEGMTPGKAPKDSDNDGMPDEWEKAHKLNPADPKDANGIVPAGASKDDRHKGYTYIEFYINELADKLIEQTIRSATSSKGR